MSNVARNHKDNVFCLLYREKKSAGLSLEEAVRLAVEECISENVLAEFFGEHKEEIIEMGVYEFDQELHDKVLLEDGEAIGLEKGKKLGIAIGKSQGIEIGKEAGIEIGSRIYKKIQSGVTDDKILAKSCGCTLAEVKAVREQFEI